MQDFIQLLGKVIDRYMISTLLAVVISATLFIFIPDTNVFILKYDKILTFVFLAILLLLLIELIKYLFVNIKLKMSASQNKCSQESVFLKSKIDEIRSQIDDMNINDRKLLYEFIESENKPIIQNGNVLYGSGSLLVSNWVHSSIYSHKSQENEKLEVVDPAQAIFRSFTDIKKQYVLNDEIYQVLKYIYNKYGKLSHFE